MAVFWGLIQSSYFFALAFAEKRDKIRNIAEIPEAIALIMFHVYRVGLLIEPAYACLVQVFIKNKSFFLT